VEIGFNVNYLLDALSAIESDKVHIGLTDSNSSCLIHAPGTTHTRYVVSLCGYSTRYRRSHRGVIAGALGAGAACRRSPDSVQLGEGRFHVEPGQLCSGPEALPWPLGIVRRTSRARLS